MNVFITGITGTIGTAIASLHLARGDTVYGCARSERGIVKWLEVNSPTRAKLFIGDAVSLASPCTDMGRLMRIGSISTLYHCAAMKHVDLCELQPHECYHQNISLTSLLAKLTTEYRIDFTFVSSDKACLPESMYGASKLVAEKLVIAEGGAVVRLGNVIGSSGSVVEKWTRALKESRDIELTDPSMTRYFMTPIQAAEFICDQSLGGYVAIPTYIRSVQMGDLANHLLKRMNQTTSGSGSQPRVRDIGARQGETKHQWLVAPGSRVLFDRLRILLTDKIGTVATDGMCSSKAPRWDMDNLLAVAGINL